MHQSTLVVRSCVLMLRTACYVLSVGMQTSRIPTGVGVPLASCTFCTTGRRRFTQHLLSTSKRAGLQPVLLVAVLSTPIDYFLSW